MTTLSQRRTVAIGQPTRADTPRSNTRPALRLAAWIRTRLVAAMDRGQLGPDAETEIGRWTGARV